MDRKSMPRLSLCIKKGAPPGEIGLRLRRCPVNRLAIDRTPDRSDSTAVPIDDHAAQRVRFVVRSPNRNLL